MYFTLRHLHSIQLTVMATALLQIHADYNRNSFTDLIHDASCPNQANGRLSINNCQGYVDCLNGFEIDRATCPKGQLYSIRSENCEDESMVPSCPRGVNNADDTKGNSDEPITCGLGLCHTPDGGCGVMHHCLIDPCEMTRCAENEICVPSFCGGCYSICTLKLNTVDQDMPTTTSTTEVPTTARTPDVTKADTTSAPIFIDDGGIHVPDDNVGTSTSTPSIVIDEPDAVAPYSTTVAPSTTEEANLPTTITTTAPKTENVAIDPTPDSSQVYIPSWIQHTCIPSSIDSTKNDPPRNNKNKQRRRLGSSWHSSYPTQYECCVNNFIYSLELFQSCVGFDLEELEPKQDDDDGISSREYYPLWRENRCSPVDGNEDVWLETTFREKKYLCCFEFMKWDFDNCLVA